jgi:spermidine/putrescine transport system permease protein
MIRGRGSVLGLVSLFGYLFLYAPIAVLVVFSFNDSRLGSVWRGFTLAWYERLLEDAQIQTSLRNSLLVAAATTLLATATGTAAALAWKRHRFRRLAALEGLLLLPIVVPEIVLASSLVLLFAALGLRLGFLSVILAHVAFSVSYAVVVVRARLAGFDRSLEEAAMDLGATPWRTFWHVTLPAIAPGVWAAALMVFALSIDDYVITSFVAGVGATTLPIQIYSMVKSGVSPQINAISTVLLAATGLLLFASYRLERGGGVRQAAPAGLLGLAILLLPFARGLPADERVLNVYIWSDYLPQTTLRRFEERHGVRVNLDLYDSNEALLAKLETGRVDYDVICPSTYVVEVLKKRDALLPLDRSALPHFENLDPRFVDQPHDPGNRLSIPYLVGFTGIAYDRKKVEAVDSWDALWDRRYAGRILMLDDPREALGAALKREGLSVNTIDPEPLRRAQAALLRQKPLVRAYNSTSFDDALLARDVWIAQGWSGQFAKVIEQDGDLAFVVPQEGSAVFLDNLAIPRSAPHPKLAHAFLDFTLEAEVAAEIATQMKYTTPNRAAHALLPPAVRSNPAIFPPADVLSRVELMRDLGDATVLYDRLWTEVKAAR